MRRATRSAVARYTCTFGDPIYISRRVSVKRRNFSRDKRNQSLAKRSAPRVNGYRVITSLTSTVVIINFIPGACEHECVLAYMYNLRARFNFEPREISRSALSHRVARETSSSLTPTSRTQPSYRMSRIRGTPYAATKGRCPHRWPTGDHGSLVSTER